MTRLFTTDVPAFRAAIAELTPRVRAAADGAGSGIRILPGTGAWWERLGDPAEGYLVDEPSPAPAEVHARLADLTVPVVVSRRRVRPDVAADAAPLETPRHVVVDAWGGRAEAATLLRDAVGWARVLAGGSLAVVARDAGSVAEVLALAGAGGVGVSVTRAVGGGVGATLTVVALGARRVEVRVDSATPVVEVVHEDDTGRSVRPARRESAERLALRRLVDALDSGERVRDLDDLAADDALVSNG